MAMLFQLSYSPLEGEVFRKGNARPLPVAGRSKAEMDRRAPTRQRTRQKVAAVKIAAVDRYQIDLIRGVRES